jgi:ankyrin repeat protein
MDLPLPLPPKSAPFGLVSVCGLLTELEDVGRVVALAGYGHEARRLPFLCTSLARDDELLVATRTAVYGEQRRTRLMYAARTGDVRRVTRLLRPGDAKLEVDATDAEGLSALHHASASGRVEVVRLLLDKGAYMDAMDTCRQGIMENSGNWRPLHYASAMGRAGVVELLLAKGSAVDGDVDPTFGDDVEQPLHVACEHGHVEVVRLLLDAGADEDLHDPESCTSFLRAVGCGGQEAVVAFLLDRGQHVDAKAKDGDQIPRTSLGWAASHGQEAMARLLLSKGADVYAVDMFGCTPLHGAAGVGSVALARLFLDKGANWEAVDFEGHTPMESAEMLIYLFHGATSINHKQRQRLQDVIDLLQRYTDDAEDWGDQDDEDEDGFGAPYRG